MKRLKPVCSVLAFAMLSATSTAFADTLEKAWETPDQLSGPESAIFDATRNVLYISNVNGEANEKDGNGFISTLSPDGSIVELNWVEGLDAPKGLALHNDKLYVSDIDTLVEIDVAKGEITNRYPAEGAKFLNDVASDQEGNIYVSDMMTDTVHRLSDGALAVWLQSEALENPNGLHVEGDQLIVGSWGRMTDGFNTDVPGHLKTVSLQDGTIKSLGSGDSVGNLDGVESDGQGNYYVTDWMAGKLFHITAAGEAEPLLELGQGSADHEVIQDQGLIIIPMMTQNKVVAYKMMQ